VGEFGQLSFLFLIVARLVSSFRRLPAADGAGYKAEREDRLLEKRGRTLLAKIWDQTPQNIFDGRPPASIHSSMHVRTRATTRKREKMRSPIFCVLADLRAAGAMRSFGHPTQRTAAK
jgi:hypothetical protein